VAAVQLGFDSTPTHGDKNIYAPDSLWTMCYSILDYHPEKKAPDVLLHRTEDCRPRRSVDEAVRLRSTAARTRVPELSLECACGFSQERDIHWQQAQINDYCLIRKSWMKTRS
jgi:hypothetical protein